MLQNWILWVMLWSRNSRSCNLKLWYVVCMLRKSLFYAIDGKKNVYLKSILVLQRKWNFFYSFMYVHSTVRYWHYVQSCRYTQYYKDVICVLASPNYIHICITKQHNGNKCVDLHLLFCIISYKQSEGVRVWSLVWA